MLAADRLLLETNLRQSAIKLREKELHLYVENFSAMATQAAFFCGFTVTSLIEVHLPHRPKAPGVSSFSLEFADLPRFFLHISGIISIAANIICVSLSTITSIYGSGKALRGKDGSMDEAVDAMAKERSTLLFFFSLGLGMNLLTVLCASVVIMDPPCSYIACLTLCATAWYIYSNSSRIVRKFTLTEHATRLDDLTNFGSGSSSSSSAADGGTEIILKSGGGANSQRAANLRINAKQTV